MDKLFRIIRKKVGRNKKNWQNVDNH
jgi:hypothetical protein